MADKELAKKVLRDGNQMRLRHRPVHHDQLRVAATPVFNDYSQGTIEHLLDINMSASDIVKKMNVPDLWQCEGKRGRTPEEAIEKAVQAGGGHVAGNSKAAIVASAMGLPTLSGSSKQIAWAQSIRSEHAVKQPDSPYLRKQKDAGWWIDNRGAL